MKLMLVADKYNSRFYSQARAAINGHNILIPKVHYDTIALYIRSCKKHGVDTIVLSNCNLLAKVVKHCTGKTIPLYRNGKKLTPSLQWAGAIFDFDGIRIIISRPFNHLVTTSYGKFLLRWYVNKHLNPSFPTAPEMLWDVCTPLNIQSYYELFQKAEYIAVDIETIKPPVDPTILEYYGDKAKGLHALMPPTKSSKKLVPCVPQIDMIGYCALLRSPDGKLYSQSIVLHLNSMEDIYWMRKFNNLEAPKICQNGGYEATYLLRYNAPLHNWLCDTFHFMHSWYAELPRSLDFITSLFMKDYQYWKDEIESNRAEYNAKDTHTTLWSWVFMVNMAPQWAKDNYLIVFRKCFPAITCGIEGFLVDPVERQRLHKLYSEEREIAQARLDAIVYKHFNPQSPAQVLDVMNSMSITKFKKSDDKALQRFAEIDPLCALIKELILTVRGATKKLSTYIEATLMDGRLLYEVNHSGTDTGRAASKSSNLWVGTQIQNQDNDLRSMYIADSIATGSNADWLIANCDGSQAESRTTAYISEDETLMDSVETAPDFHRRNASLFFGIPEDEISKAIRTLSKRVNHGSNYNMGASVLLETMGSKNVIEAKALLNLPRHYGLIDTCKHLLQTFEDTYPKVKGKYYDEVCEEIRITSMLRGATGWTRYCFEIPSRAGAKPILNKYVAHSPQSLSVMMVDEAEFDFWLEYQIGRGVARLKAQVHDEVVYMIQPVHYPETKKALSDLMARPITVRGRELIVPNDGGGCDFVWGNIKD